MTTATERALKELKGTRYRGAFEHRGPVLFIAVYGPYKTGKTHLAKTAPGPIAYQSIDYGHVGVLDEEIERGHVLISTYDSPDTDRIKGEGDSKRLERLQKEATPVWEDIHDDYVRAMNADSIRTVVWDKGTEIWETLELARTGKVREIPPLERGKLKREMGSLLRRAQRTPKNFIYLADTADVWKGQKATGATKPRGFDVGPYAEVIVQMGKRRKKGENHFTMEIMDCRYNRDLEGEVLEDADFMELANLVRPDIEMEDLICDC